MDTAEPMSIEEMCAVVERGKNRVLYLERRERELEARNAEIFDMYREARDGLWALRQSSQHSEFLRDAAARIECGTDCPHDSYDHTCNAHECDLLGKDEECAAFLAQQLRELADGYDVLRTTRATPPDVDNLHADAWGTIAAEAMSDAWNEICADTECHPTDITQLGRRQLGFVPHHWARLTGLRIAGILQRMRSSGEREP